MGISTMLRKKIQIINKHGLHARAADKFVKTASHYGSEIEIIYNGKHANGKSIMAVMTLGAKKGSEIELVVKGRDEEKALKELEDLIESRFGEKE